MLGVINNGNIKYCISRIDNYKILILGLRSIPTKHFRKISGVNIFFITTFIMIDILQTWIQNIKSNDANKVADLYHEKGYYLEPFQILNGEVRINIRLF